MEIAQLIRQKALKLGYVKGENAQKDFSAFIAEKLDPKLKK